MKQLICFVVLLICFSTSLFSKNLVYYDSVNIYRQLHIEDFNLDNVQDTIIGRMYADYCVLPQYIIWGKDSTITIPDSLWNIYSEIVFPAFRQVSSSFSIERNNYDTIPDIYFSFRGFYLDTLIAEGDTTITCKDTSDVIVLFGQSSLNSFRILRLDTISNLSAEPFYAKRRIDSLDNIQTFSTSNFVFEIKEIPRYNIEIPPPDTLQL